MVFVNRFLGVDIEVKTTSVRYIGREGHRDVLLRSLTSGTALVSPGKLYLGSIDAARLTRRHGSAHGRRLRRRQLRDHQVGRASPTTTETKMSTKGSVKPASPLELVSVAGGLVQPLPCRRLPHDAPALGGTEGTGLERGR